MSALFGNMSLVSASFIVFLISALFVYYLLPHKWQWVILLFESVLFFALCGTFYTIIYVALSTISVYLGTRFMSDENPKKKKGIYVVTLCFNLIILFVLKYSNFALQNVYLFKTYILHDENASLTVFNIVSSLGISFYALSMISYLTDVYWGIVEKENNIFKVALFNIYFPNLISGPINRFGNIKDELFAEHDFDGKRVYEGVLRILLGFFKKLMVSEHLAPLTAFLYDNYQTYDGIYVWIGTALFVIQLYADFSGCMDIVLGASECFGIKIVENFDRPFASETIQEFWQRWHITLGLFFKDYLMYPILRSKLFSKMTKSIKKKLGKTAAKRIPTYIAMFILWFAIGLWHGGGYNYIGEGIYFFIFIVLGQILDRPLKSINRFLHIDDTSVGFHRFRTIRTAICYGGGILFFKASSLTQGLKMIGSAVNPSKVFVSVGSLKESIMLLDETYGTNNMCWSALAVALGLTVMVILGFKAKKNITFMNYFSSKSYMANVVMWVAVIMVILVFGAFGPGYVSGEFIYGGF